MILATPFMAPTHAKAFQNKEGGPGTTTPTPVIQQEEKPAFKDYTFDLSKTLKTGEEQKQTYLWGEKNEGPGEKGPLVAILLRVIEIMTYVIGSLAFVIIVFSGLWLIAAHGEQSQIEKGKKILTYSIVGLIFAFASYIIITFVQSLLA